MLHSDSYSCSTTVRRVPLLPGQKVALVGRWVKSCMSTHHVVVFVIVRPERRGDAQRKVGQARVFFVAFLFFQSSPSS